MEDERRYKMLYFPKDQCDQVEEVYDKLLDIDSNFSRFMQEILLHLGAMTDVILEKGKNYRHYIWGIVIIDRNTLEKIESFDLNILELENGKKENEKGEGKENTAGNNSAEHEVDNCGGS